MALKSVLESIEDLDENIQQEYSEKQIDGKTVYVLQVDGVREHPDVKNLKTALDRQKDENKTLKTKLTETEAQVNNLPEDFDVDEWLRLKQLEEDLDDDDSEEAKRKRKERQDERLAQQRKQYEERIASLQKKYDEDIAARDAEIEDTRKGRALDRAETQLTQALGKAGVRPGLMKAAKALLTGSVKHEYEDGELRVFVETDMGETDIEQYVTSWAESDEGKEFVAPPTGGGADGQQKGSKDLNNGQNPFTKAGWSKTQQGALHRTDRVKAERMAKAAGFSNLDVAIAARSAITND